MARFGHQGEPLVDLLLRLIDAARAYLLAELELWRRVAMERLGAARLGIVLAAIAILLMQAALTVLVAALGLFLAHWLGTAGGLAAAALIAVGIATALIARVLRRLTAMGRDR